MTGAHSSVRVLIAGGGTAGHVLPGLAIAQALVARGLPHRDVAFVGSDRGVERRLVTPAGFDVTELPGRGIQRRFTWGNVPAVLGLCRGLFKGIGLVRRARPGVVVVLGGYASFACGVGAVVWRRPLVLCEQNARAGAVNRALRFFARRSVVAFPDTDLPRTVVTGNPLRAEISEAARAREADPSGTRARARAELGLPSDRTVVLVATGSLGARRVNVAVRELAGRWRSRDDLAIRHVVGRRDFAEFARSPAVSETDELVYQLVEYEDRMELALAAADLVIGRSGGGVAELAAMGVPAVLVPLPIAPRDHQGANAEHYADGGGAIVVDDVDCTGAHLADLLEPIVADQARRDAMAGAMRQMARPDAADAVASVVLELADGH